MKIKFRTRSNPITRLNLAALAVIGCIVAGPARAADAGVDNGVIPPPDEAHASHPIGMCGTRHYEPRLEFCDTRDNHIYRMVKIGTQVWMAENLDYGTMIPGTANQTQKGQKYCLSNDSGKCAALYQWAEAVDLDPSYNKKTAGLTGPVQGICPAGWRLPMPSDWETLKHVVDQAQGAQNEAPSLMYYSLDNDFKWKTNTDPDISLPRDKYGMAVLPTGERVPPGDCPVGQKSTSSFCFAHDRAFFWTSDDHALDGDPGTAVDYSFTEDQPQINEDNIGTNPKMRCARCTMKEAQKVAGMSVRCIKD